MGIWGENQADLKVQGGTLSPASASPWNTDFDPSELCSLGASSFTFGCHRVFMRLISGNIHAYALYKLSYQSIFEIHPGAHNAK